jgi:hypothetical protein
MLVCFISNMRSMLKGKTTLFFVIFLFCLLIIQRGASFIFDSQNIIIINIIAVSVFLLCYANLGMFFYNVFFKDKQNVLQIMFFWGCGVTPVWQISIKLFSLFAGFCLIFSLLSAFIMEFNFRFLVIGLLYVPFLFFVCNLVFAIGSSRFIKAIFVIAGILTVLSYFLPVFILPNPIYILQSGFVPVLVYVFLYFMFYLLGGFLFFNFYRRSKC